MLLEPRALLMELPVHVIETILEYAGVKARMSFRKCSQTARRLVDDTKCHIDALELQITPEGGADLLLGSASHVYYKSCDVALQDFATILANHRLRIGFLHVEDVDVFTSLEQLLKVDELHLKLKEGNLKLKDVLRALHPGTLKTINVRWDSDGEDVDLEDVFKTEQWKKAREVTLSKCQRSLFSLENWTHLERFEVTLPLISLKLVQQVVQHVLKVNTTCHYMFCGELQNANQVEKYLESISRRVVEETGNVWNYSLTNNASVLISRPFGYVLFVK